MSQRVGCLCSLQDGFGRNSQKPDDFSILKCDRKPPPVNRSWASIHTMCSPPTRIFISPHPDDIAYSCYASLVSPLADCTRTLIVTVFGSSIRARGSLGSRGSKDEISAARLQEDREFTSITKCNLLSLKFHDSSLRYKEWVAFDALDPRADPVFARVKRALRRIIKTLLGGASIFIPLGIGSHIDHCIVREAVRDILCEYWIAHGSYELFYFEDLPYAAVFKDTEIERFARMTISPTAKPIIVSLESLWCKKKAAIETYDSQLKPSVLPAISQHALRLGCQKSKGERIWVDKTGPETAEVTPILTDQIVIVRSE